MATVTVKFDDGFEGFEKEFDVSDYLEDEIDEFLEDNPGIVKFDIVDWDDDYADPNSFNTLNDYVDYIEKCEKYGEAFVLRYEDVECEDIDEYEGCFNDTEEFAQHVVEEFYNLDIPHWVEIDWESTARNIMMDFSEYEGAEGIHIFRNC